MKQIKEIAFLILISTATITMANHQQPSTHKTIEVVWLPLSDSVQKRIVREYVNTLDSFTFAMPIVGGNTESTWAADTVHTMAQRVREGQQSFLKNMADIYQMHSYIAYGMLYFNAIIGFPHDITEVAHYFDARTNPVFDYYYDGKEIQYLSDKEFEEYMLKAARYKADLLRIATQELLVMKTTIP